MVEKTQNKGYFYVLLVLVLCMGLVVLWPMRDIILLAWVITTLFRPVYEFLLHKAKFPKIAATLTSVLAVLFTLLVPISVFINLSLAQFKIFYNDLNAFLQGGTSVYDVIVGIFDKINVLLTRIPYLDYKVSIEGVQTLIQQNLAPVANYLLNSSLDAGVSFAKSFPMIVVFMYLLWFGFPEYERIVHFLKRLSPLPEKLDDLYLNRVTAMIRGIARGTFMIAFIQGTIATFSLWIAGVPYIFFWFLTTIIFSVLPLGASFVTVPAAAILFMVGNYWQAVFILVVQFLFTSIVDNILRPYLIQKDVEIHPALLLLSFIGGIQVFGIWGFIYGPLIMVVLMTTLEVYQKHYKVKE